MFEDLELTRTEYHCPVHGLRDHIFYPFYYRDEISTPIFTLHETPGCPLYDLVKVHQIVRFPNRKVLVSLFSSASNLSQNFQSISEGVTWTPIVGVRHNVRNGP